MRKSNLTWETLILTSPRSDRHLLFSILSLSNSAYPGSPADTCLSTRLCHLQTVVDKLLETAIFSQEFAQNNLAGIEFTLQQILGVAFSLARSQIGQSNATISSSYATSYLEGVQFTKLTFNKCEYSRSLSAKLSFCFVNSSVRMLSSLSFDRAAHFGYRRCLDLSRSSYRLAQTSSRRLSLRRWYRSSSYHSVSLDVPRFSMPHVWSDALSILFPVFEQTYGSFRSSWEDERLSSLIWPDERLWI